MAQARAVHVGSLSGSDSQRAGLAVCQRKASGWKPSSWMNSFERFFVSYVLETNGLRNRT